MPDDDLLALPPELRDQARRLLDTHGDTREAYGYPRDGAPLTFAEIKAGEIRNGELCAAECVAEHRGRHDLEENDYSDYWHRRPTSSRDLPLFAYRTVLAGCYTTDGALDVVADAWTQPEWPEGNFGASFWRRLFGETGYLHRDHVGETTTARRHVVPTLWRGAIHSRRKGLAWTSSRDRAAWFADRWAPGGHYKQAHLWRLDGVAADRVLARFDARGEAEWVIDARRLTPVLQRREAT